jgi:hypothetical protein
MAFRILLKDGFTSFTRRFSPATGSLKGMKASYYFLSLLFHIRFYYFIMYYNYFLCATDLSLLTGSKTSLNDVSPYTAAGFSFASAAMLTK